MIGAVLVAASLLAAPHPAPVDCAVDQVRGFVATAAHELPDGWSWDTRCGESDSGSWGETIKPVVRIWPRMAPTGAELEDLVLHELGHVAAWQLEAVEQVYWTVERHGDWEGEWDWSLWASCHGSDDPDCVDGAVEDFAESWSHCQGHGDPDRHWDQYGPAPTGEECARLRSLLVGDPEYTEPDAG